MAWVVRREGSDGGLRFQVRLGLGVHAHSTCCSTA
jgi:hypothetical protein